MTGLNNLKLVSAKQERANANPQASRRQKFAAKISEQIKLAQAQLGGTRYQPVKLKRVLDAESGVTSLHEVPKRIKAWWWSSGSGKFNITLRYGAKVLEISKGKNAIETGGIAEVISTLELIKLAVEKGDLDRQIEELRGVVSAGFKRKLQKGKAQI